MSDFLKAVQFQMWVAEAHRIDPHVFCMAYIGPRNFWFCASDDGWYGWLVAQYPRSFPASSVKEVAQLIHLVERNGSLFRIEVNGATGIVRGVMQLPIADEPRLEDDVPAAISTLTDEWGTFLPFLDRIAAGETAEAIRAEARAAFDALDERNRTPRATPPDETVGN